MLMPRVTSALLARHEAHVLDGLGAMGTPHMQQRTFTMVPPPTAARDGSIGSSMVATSACLANCFYAGKEMRELVGAGAKEMQVAQLGKKHRRQMQKTPQCAKFIQRITSSITEPPRAKKAEDPTHSFLFLLRLHPLAYLPTTLVPSIAGSACTGGLIVPQPQITRYILSSIHRNSTYFLALSPKIRRRHMT